MSDLSKLVKDAQKTLDILTARGSGQGTFLMFKNVRFKLWFDKQKNILLKRKCSHWARFKEQGTAPNWDQKTQFIKKNIFVFQKETPFSFAACREELIHHKTTLLPSLMEGWFSLFRYCCLNIKWLTEHHFLFVLLKRSGWWRIFPLLPPPISPNICLKIFTSGYWLNFGHLSGVFVIFFLLYIALENVANGRT